MPDFLPLMRETRELNWSFLTLLPHLRFEAYLAARLLFLVLTGSSAGFFCKLSTYHWETTLDKFYTVNVLRGNDLNYDVCKRVQDRPNSVFPAKGKTISGTAIDLVPEPEK